MQTYGGKSLRTPSSCETTLPMLGYWIAERQAESADKADVKKLASRDTAGTAKMRGIVIPRDGFGFFVHGKRGATGGAQFRPELPRSQTVLKATALRWSARFFNPPPRRRLRTKSLMTTASPQHARQARRCQRERCKRLFECAVLHLT